MSNIVHSHLKTTRLICIDLRLKRPKGGEDAIIEVWCDNKHTELPVNLGKRIINAITMQVVGEVTVKGEKKP